MSIDKPRYDSSTNRPLPLPPITDEPAKQRGSCAFMSARVLSLAISLIPSGTSLVLSIGSGLGLLEAHIASAIRTLQLTCVEVESFRYERKYILEKDMVYVPGTWKASEIAQNASFWMFIFPRDPSLMRKYVTSYGGGKVKRILWIGPREDWSAFKDSVQHDKFASHYEIGMGILQPNEMGWLWSSVEE